MSHLKRHSCCAARTPRSWDRGGDKMHCTWRMCACQAPGHVSCLDLGWVLKAGPTESAPVWSTREHESEWLRPGKCTQCRARFRQFPCRATWRLSSVDWDSTHTVSRGKLNMAETLRAIPTHASDICLQCSFLPTARLNK